MGELISYEYGCSNCKFADLPLDAPVCEACEVPYFTNFEPEEGELPAADVAPMRWIPAETLPPEGVDVLAIDQNGFYGIGDNSGECFADGHREWFFHDYRFEKPTHWMPLPPPPKEET